ncbi:hypothetical protein [Pseudomonas sp. EMN2]|uniref:hypothetical protein n=2 Tax=Pseudomonas TaxID=286 RepID=UPI0015B70D2A|nr:hypothetical protein [Pseudomonas sp. EMN2]
MMSKNLISDTHSAAIVEQSLVAFAAGMSLQNRTDVMNSYQFASLVASRLYDSENQSEAWYKQNLKVMEDLGWLTVRRTYEREHSDSQSLTLGAVAFKAMRVVGQAAFGGPVSEAIGKLAEAALEGLGQVTEAQDIFKHNFREKLVGTIGLAACLENEEGQLMMVQTAVSTKGMSRDLDTVAFEWKNTDTYHYSGTALLTFNNDHYARVREHVEQRLGERRFENVLQYDF